MLAKPTKATTLLELHEELMNDSSSSNQFEDERMNGDETNSFDMTQLIQSLNSELDQAFAQILK